MKQYYEFLGIVPGNIAENEVPAVMKNIAGFFADKKAEVSYQEIMGRKRMAYPIRKLRYGYYLLLEFIVDKQKLEEIEKKLKLNDSLLRFLIIKSQPKSREEREKAKTKKIEDEKKSSTPTSKEEDKEANKISLDDLDKKLDEILDEKI